MGFFSRKKDESSNLPPAPMPPVSQGMDKLNGAPGEVSRQAPYLSSPAIPSKNSLDDIKSQVVSNNRNLNSNSNSGMQMGGYQQSPSEENINLNDDSLFDFSGLDLDESGVNNNQNGFENNNSLEESSLNHSSSAVDRNLTHQGNLSFVTNRNRLGKPGVSDNLYVTTSQFKTFLEIIEQVRSRVKDSSDRHLRLLDIKSEEDVEYENLRKDFQYIEDKLYEVDSLIFDR